MSTPPGQIVYFGDSLTDDGNLFAYAELILEPDVAEGFGGPTGSASDGPTHATYTGDILDVDTQNYAVASAEVDGVQDLAYVAANFDVEDSLIVDADDPLLDTDINLNGQVNRFLTDNYGADLSDTTAMIWIGANDYNEVDLTSPTFVQDVFAKMDAILTGIAEEAIRLSNAGVGTIQIVSLPAVDFYAVTALLSEEDQALANIVFELHNRFLQDTIDLLQGAGFNAQFLDITHITDALTEDPTGFGVIAPLGTMLKDLDDSSGFDADQVFSTDELHPTTAVHGVIGAYNAMVLEGGTSTKLSDLANFHRGGGTDDFVAGLGGTDIILAGAGDDVVLGGSGIDDLAGQDGSDVLSGGSGGDFVRGNRGDDIIGGGEGDDRILAGRNNDLVIDGLGNDEVRGGFGDDTFIFTEASLIGGTSGDQDLFIGGHGTDTLIVVLSEDSFATHAADLEGGSPNAALSSLGISAGGIEHIIAVETRDGLGAFADESWYAQADLWGLI